MVKQIGTITTDQSPGEPYQPVWRITYVYQRDDGSYYITTDPNCSTTGVDQAWVDRNRPRFDGVTIYRYEFVESHTNGSPLFVGFVIGEDNKDLAKQAVEEQWDIVAVWLGTSDGSDTISGYEKWDYDDRVYI